MRAVISQSEKRLDGQRKCNEEARARQLRNNISVAFCGLFLLGAFAATNIVLLQSVLKDPLGGERSQRFIGPLLREKLRTLARKGRNKLTGRHDDRPQQTEKQLAWARAAASSGDGSTISGHVVKQLAKDIVKDIVAPAAEGSSTSSQALKGSNLRGSKQAKEENSNEPPKAGRFVSEIVSATAGGPSKPRATSAKTALEASQLAEPETSKEVSSKPEPADPPSTKGVRKTQAESEAKEVPRQVSFSPAKTGAAGHAAGETAV